MTSFKKKGGIYKVLKWMPRVVLIFTAEGRFRNGGPFSQRGPFLQPISHLRNEEGVLRNGTCVPKGCFAAAKHPAKLGFGCENGVFKALRISQPFCSCEMRVGGCEMALVC